MHFYLLASGLASLTMWLVGCPDENEKSDIQMPEVEIKGHVQKSEFCDLRCEKEKQLERLQNGFHGVNR